MTDSMRIHDLLDDVRIAELNQFLERSHDAPQRFIAWTEQHGLLVVLDLVDGAIARAQYGEASREEAEAAIAELQGAMH